MVPSEVDANPSDVAERLERDDATGTVTAFPDGSVDTFYEVSLAGERVDTREAFAEAVRGAWSDAFGLERTSVEPGGHAPNLAAQSARLGDDATLVGHLDHPVFEAFPADAVSMGEPATVSIHEFDDGDVLTVETSGEITSWSFEDLRAALGDGFADGLSVDAACCVNWTSVDALPEALGSLADADPASETVLVDPGAPPRGSNSDAAGLLDALGRLATSSDVVLAGNPAEVETMAAAAGEASDHLRANLATLRERAGIDATVAHGEERATAVTADGHYRVENFDVEPTRATGGGDRFDAGLVHALHRGWGWEAALTLGNACASYYVGTGETGTAGDLADFLRERA